LFRSGAIRTGAMGTAINGGGLSNSVGTTQSAGTNAAAIRSLHATDLPVIVPNVYSCNSYTSANCNPTRCVCAVTAGCHEGRPSSAGLRLEERRAKLLGLDATQRLEEVRSNDSRGKTSGLPEKKAVRRRERREPSRVRWWSGPSGSLSMVLRIGGRPWFSGLRNAGPSCSGWTLRSGSRKSARLGFQARRR
jgi:hypothetical protein